jgi:hypothetical protein
VLSFASGLGAGNEIAELLVARCADGQSGHFGRALRLISDPDADISEPCALGLIEGAFRAVEQGDKDNFDLGLAIANLAATRQDLVGPMAAARLA